MEKINKQTNLWKNGRFRFKIICWHVLNKIKISKLFSEINSDIWNHYKYENELLPVRSENQILDPEPPRRTRQSLYVPEPSPDYYRWDMFKTISDLNVSFHIRKLNSVCKNEIQIVRTCARNKKFHSQILEQ